MAQFFDISDWNELPWFNTGGTRAKKFVQGPDGNFYYFKRSQYKPATTLKPGKDFRYEFWSEIIAHHVGVFLGFDVLKYDMAFDGVNMGCISKTMVDSGSHHFIEGIRFLQGYNPDYDPENKAHRSLYNFQAIEAALDKFALGRFNKNIVEAIIFDAVIGNGDRHQENWAIIMDHSAIPNALEKIASLTEQQREEFDKNSFFEADSVLFAPIYDSGSSLGRELTETRIADLLGSEFQMSRYINKGMAEIHWENEKVTHFELLKKLLETHNKNIILNKIEEVSKRDVENYTYELLTTIDLELPDFLADHKIPDIRKQFIAKLIITRIEELKKLGDARI